MPHELLYLPCQTLDDLERTRIAIGHRLRIMTQPVDVVDKDGERRGLGLSENDREVALQRVAYDTLKDLEATMDKDIRRLVAEHPLGPWITAQHGVGARQAGRLLAAIGDPYWNPIHDRPRRVAELWAYCGLVPGKRRRKGTQANWSRDAKMRTWLIVQSIIKAGGPWKEVWDEARERYRSRLHEEPCDLCGTREHEHAPVIPAPVGSLWADRHQKAATDRYVGKRLLRELWREARRIHGVTDDSDGLVPYAPAA